MTMALQDLKVVDVTRTLAGPFCTMMLGDMGADVVKIEEPNHGDETRSWTPFWNGESTQFLSFNRNKRSLSLNLREKEGVEIGLGLAAKSDIMIESFRAGALDRMGLGYEAVRKVNPNIIYCSISGYGRTGPMSDKPGYDLIIQAYSGLMSLTGDPDGEPKRVGFSLVDLFAGMMAYGCILTALHHRQATGKGTVDRYVLAGRAGGRHELSRHRVPGHRCGAPSLGLRAPQSGALPEFSRLRRLLHTGLRQRRPVGAALQVPWGADDLLEDPRFKTNTDRVEHRAECVETLNQIFQEKTVAQWVDVISDAGVPCGPINKVSEVVNDAQVLSRDMVVDMPHPNVPDLRVPNSPLKLTETPPSIRRPPPLLGQHNEEILEESGYSQEQIARLMEKGVIGS